MTKARTKGKPKARARKTAPQPAIEIAAPHVADVAELRDLIAMKVRSEALNMVESTIDNVKEGHYLGMKYLFEMVALYPIASEAESPQDDSLAAILLRRLGVSDDLTSDTAVTKDSITSTHEDGGDTVE